MDGKVSYSGIEMIKPATGLSVSLAPNPVHDRLIVSSTDNIKTLSIINSKGQIVKQVFVSGITNQHEIELKELPAGSYFIKVAGENQGWTRQFIKQ
ncbi:MAG: T9SS type A sorting domain-containing protein [Chitinophagaceae bacterium]|nr:T9SS type A sorting domain-containing protein [Chitinophagaceae bacterium]